MPVVFESDGGAAFCGSTAGAVPVALPPTRPVGSVLLFVAICRLITAAAPAPSGYTLLGTYTSGTASGGRIWIYGRVVDGSEVALSIVPTGVTGNSGDIWGACLFCYSGVDTSGGIANIFDGTPTTTDASATTVVTFPALTISRADSLLVGTLTRFIDSATNTYTPTAGWNEREDLASTSRTGGNIFLQDKLATVSGSQASVTVTPLNTTNSRYLAVSFALKSIPPKQTSIARISLASASVPATRTGHTIMVRARKTNAAHTAKINVALYEGGTQRGLTIQSSELTTSFANYSFGIGDAGAAAITDYSNLEVYLWGTASSGSATVFEVSQLWLEIPAAAAATPTPISLSASLTVTPALTQAQRYRRAIAASVPLTPVLKKLPTDKLTLPGSLPLTPAISTALRAYKTIPAGLPLITAQVKEPSRLAASALSLPSTISPLFIAGGGAGFVPSDLTGLSNWYKADALALSNGAAVTSWADSSGAGRTLTGNALFQTNQLNGKPGVQFDGIDDYLTHLAGAAYITGKEVTVFAVFKHLVYNSNGRMMAFNATDDIDYQTPSWCIYEGGGGAQRVAPYSNGELAIDALLSPDAVLMTTWFDAADTHNLRINRAPASTPSFSTAQMGTFTFQTKRFTLSSGFIGSPTSSGNNIFHEVVIYDRALNSTERSQVEAYLDTKWFGAAPGLQQIDLSAGLAIAPIISKLARSYRTIPATATVTPALNKEPSRLQAASLSLAPAVTKEPSRSLPANLTLTPSISKIVAHYRALTSGLTLTPALARKLTAARALAAGLTISPALIKEPSRSLTAGLPLTTALLREMYELFPGSLILAPEISAVAGKGKTLPASLALTPTLNEKQTRALSSSLVISPALNRELGRSASASLPLTSAILREMYEPFSVGLTLTPAISDIATHYKTLTGVLPFSPALVRVFTAKRTLTAALILSPALNRKLAKSLTANLPLTLALIREIQRPAFGVVNLVLSPVITPLARHWMTMAVGISLNPDVSVKSAGKWGLSSTLNLNPALVKEPTRFISTGLVLSPALTRQMAYRRSISASLPLTAALIEAERYRRTLSAVLSLSPALALRSSHFRAINASLALTAALSRSPTRRLTAGLPLSASLGLVKTLRLPILLAAELQLISELEVSTAEEIELAADLELLAELFRILPPQTFPPPDEILGGISKPVILSANGGDEAQIISVGSESLYVGK